MCNCPWPDRRVLFFEAMHRRADLVFVAAGLRLDGVGQHRLRELYGGEGDGVSFLAERVVRERVLQLRDRAEIASLDLRDAGLGLALEQEQVPEALRRIARLVVDPGVGLQGA
jgi:hypothetical protein